MVPVTVPGIPVTVSGFYRFFLDLVPGVRVFRDGETDPFHRWRGPKMGLPQLDVLLENPTLWLLQF